MAGFESSNLRRVRTPRDWATVRGLRFAGLLGRGDVEPGPRNAFGDPFDEEPNTTTYLLSAGDVAFGTTRTSVTGPALRGPLPSQSIFAREIDAAFGTDATVVEASLTFVDPQAARDPQEALMRLFKVHILHCAAESADALVVAVRDSQMGFYRRRFGMEILSGEERYPGMRSPRVLMGIAWREKAPSLLRRIPALAASAEDEAQFARL